MKKIVALAFGICLMGGAVSAQTLDSKYGLDSVNSSCTFCSACMRRVMGYTGKHHLCMRCTMAGFQRAIPGRRYG